MRTSARAIQFIKDHEGFRDEAYQCASGVWTIGWGHTSDARYPVREGMKITKATAEKMLEHDIREAEAAIAKFLHNEDELNGNQFGALVSLIFNIGNAAFGRSRLAKLLNKGDFDGASREFGKWVWSRGRRLTGLVRRRAEEKALFMTPAALADKVVRQPPIKGATPETIEGRDAKHDVDPAKVEHDGTLIGTIVSIFATAMTAILGVVEQAKDTLTTPSGLITFGIIIVLAYVAYKIYMKKVAEAG